MRFAQAMEGLAEGKRAMRANWTNDAFIFVEDKRLFMMLGVNRDGNRAVIHADISWRDMMAKNWKIVA